MKKILFFIIFCLFNINAFAKIPVSPNISARSYILIEQTTGKVLASENENERLPPASLTKVMTAYVVFKEIKEKRLSLKDEVLISEKAWKTQGSKTYIEVGKKIKVEDLIKGMIIQSGNDASVALAEHISGTETQFTKLMNYYANELGMKNSHFSNVTGLPISNHYSTAYDLGILTKKLIKEFPELYTIYSYDQFTYNDITQRSRNRLLHRDNDYDGVKTGFTNDAGYCFIGSAKRNERRLISVILGAKNPEIRFEDTKKLMNYGFTFYETHKIFEKNEYIPQLTTEVFKGSNEEVKIGLEEEVYLTLEKGEYDNIKFKINIFEKIVAPISSGEIVGKMEIINSENKVILNRNIIALEDINKGDFFKIVYDTLRLKFNF